MLGNQCVTLITLCARLGPSMHVCGPLPNSSRLTLNSDRFPRPIFASLYLPPLLMTCQQTQKPVFYSSFQTISLIKVKDRGLQQIEVCKCAVQDHIGSHIPFMTFRANAMQDSIFGGWGCVFELGINGVKMGF